jgi:3-dehydroquinate dehydratase II
VSAAPLRIALLHGPNLGMLGRRPSEHYGTLTLRELEERVREWGRERGMIVGCFQSDHEGAFLQHVHQWSIRDALEIMGAPFVEVHLSDIEAREPHRRVSVIRDVASTAVWGRGPDGYRDALDHLAGLLA